MQGNGEEAGGLGGDTEAGTGANLPVRGKVDDGGGGRGWASSFGGRRAGGNGFRVGVRGSIVGGGEGGGLSEIIQDMHMYQFPLYASQGFDDRSDGGGLRGIERMRPWRRGVWRRGHQRRGTLSSSYWP